MNIDEYNYMLNNGYDSHKTIEILESTAQIVDSHRFWMLMCDYRFIRLTPYRGVISNQYFVTKIPPESLDGFIESKILDIARNLHPAKSESLSLISKIVSVFTSKH